MPADIVHTPSTMNWLRPLRWAGPPMSDPISTPPGVEEAFALPVGTVTFLLTDVEGSTQGWQTNGPAMGAAITRHYEILDAAVAAHGGVRPQEQGEGDSIVAAFGRASDALLAAIDAQRALSTEPWAATLAKPLKVRMAIHTGEAQMRNEANYVGQAIIRTARLRAIAHGGQVLVSQAARDLAVDQHGEQIDLLDLGTHRLKDLARPEHVWQLAAEGLDREFPPLRSLDATPNNLPMELSSFIGRTAEIATVTELVERNRLVVVNGAGGAGKTRLAQQVAAHLVDRHPDGVWWIELAPLDSASVLSTIASVVSVTDPATLVDRLAARHVMLVLDNCEHVLDVITPLAHAIHTRCPNVHVLATSRGPLDVPGEITWRVPPLSLPQPGAHLPVERLAQFDAVRLFIERARRARPNFVLTNDNGPTVAALCARLDAIPLAIELAAARAKSLTPAMILSGLEDSLRLLTGGSSVLLPRQQTLEASIDWSHNLLGDHERVLLRRMSVFAGGCDLAAAEAVCADDTVLTELDVLDALERLIDQSLVTVNERGSTARYQLLETVRQYAARQLLAADEASVVAERHTQYYARLALTWGPRSEGPREFECVDIMYPERDNLGAALARLRDAGRTDELVAAVLATAPLWDHSAQLQTAKDWTDTALELTGPEPTITRGRLLQARIKHAMVAGDMVSAAGLALQPLPIAERFDDTQTIGRARFYFWTVQSMFDPVSAPPAFDLAAAECRAVGDLYGEALIQNTRVSFRRDTDLHADAEALERAADVVARLANPATTATWNSWRSLHCLRGGDLRAADAAVGAMRPHPDISTNPMAMTLQTMVDLAVATNSGASGPGIERMKAELQTLRRTDSQMMVPVQRGLIAQRLHLQGDFAAARDEVDSALAEAQAAGPFVMAAAWSLPGIGAVAALALGDLPDARRRLDSMGTMAPGFSERTEAQLTLALILRAEGDVAGAEGETHGAIAVAAEQGMMRELLLGLEVLAGLAAAQGSWQESARLAGAAQRQREERGLGLRVEPHRSQHANDQVATRAALGDDAYAAAIGEGRALSLDDAVAFSRRSRGQRGRPTLGWASLTPTERRVADLARAGKANAAIAAELLMGSETVKTHLSRIYAKLGVANRTELAAMKEPPPPSA